MQKFKITRWPKYNPAGDVLRTKLIWLTTWTSGLASPSNVTAIPAIGSIPFLMIDLFEILNSPLWAGTAHPRSSASFQAAVLFSKFRLTGVKIQWQSMLIGSSGAGTNDPARRTVENTPYKFAVTAGGLDSGLTTSLPINAFITGEQRWAIVRDVDTPGQAKNWHSVYFSVAKLIGLPYNKTDSVYSGGTDGTTASGFAAAPTSRPLLGPWYRFGIVPINGVGPPATYDPNFQTQMKFTFYVTYFDKIANLTQ